VEVVARLFRHPAARQGASGNGCEAVARRVRRRPEKLEGLLAGLVFRAFGRNGRVSFSRLTPQKTGET
jgi:hypothetical protein